MTDTGSLYTLPFFHFQDEALPDGGERGPPPPGGRRRRRELHLERQLHAAAVVKILNLRRTSLIVDHSFLIFNTIKREHFKFWLEFYCVNSLKLNASLCSLTVLQGSRA